MLRTDIQTYSTRLQALEAERALIKDTNTLFFIPSFQGSGQHLTATLTGVIQNILTIKGFSKEYPSYLLPCIPATVWKLLKGEGYQRAYIYYPVDIRDDVMLDAGANEIMNPQPNKCGSWATLRSDAFPDTTWTQSLEHETNTVLYNTEHWKADTHSSITWVLGESNFPGIEWVSFLYPRSTGFACGDTLTTVLLDNVNRYRNQWQGYSQNCTNQTCNSHLLTYRLWICYIRNLNNLFTVHGCNTFLSIIIEQDYSQLNAASSYLLKMVCFALEYRFYQTNAEHEFLLACRNSLDYLTRKSDIQI